MRATSNTQPQAAQALTIVKPDLLTEYSHLTPITGVKDHKEVFKITKNNLIAELKHNFKGVKFRVTKQHYSTYNVEWTDGPSNNAVDEICERFESYQSDETGDYRDFTPTEFNDLFGGFKYIFTRREKSDKIEALTAKCEAIMNGFSNYTPRPNEGSDLMWRIFRKTSLPVNFTSCDIVRTEKTAGLTEDLYTILTK